MPKQRIYAGPSPAVELVLPNGQSLVCTKGVPVEVPDELVKSLDAQGWLTPKTKFKAPPPEED